MVNLDKEYKRVAKELNLPAGLIKEVYAFYWNFMKKNFNELLLYKMNYIPKERFDKYLMQFNVPEFGKLYITHESYILDCFNKLKKTDKTNVFKYTTSLEDLKKIPNYKKIQKNAKLIKDQALIYKNRHYMRKVSRGSEEGECD